MVGTRSTGWLARALAAPGIWLQKLTTRVPDRVPDRGRHLELRRRPRRRDGRRRHRPWRAARRGARSSARRLWTDTSDRGGLMDDTLGGGSPRSSRPSTRPRRLCPTPRRSPTLRCSPSWASVTPTFETWCPTSASCVDCGADLEEARAMADDPDMADLARELGQARSTRHRRTGQALP